jgi:hypothetical protein
MVRSAEKVEGVRLAVFLPWGPFFLWNPGMNWVGAPQVAQGMYLSVYPNPPEPYWFYQDLYESGAPPVGTAPGAGGAAVGAGAAGAPAAAPVGGGAAGGAVGTAPIGGGGGASGAATGTTGPASTGGGGGAAMAGGQANVRAALLAADVPVQPGLAPGTRVLPGAPVGPLGQEQTLEWLAACYFPGLIPGTGPAPPIFGTGAGMPGTPITPGALGAGGRPIAPGGIGGATGGRGGRGIGR